MNENAIIISEKDNKLTNKTKPFSESKNCKFNYGKCLCFQKKKLILCKLLYTCM